MNRDARLSRGADQHLFFWLATTGWALGIVAIVLTGSFSAYRYPVLYFYGVILSPLLPWVVLTTVSAPLILVGGRARAHIPLHLLLAIAFMYVLSQFESSGRPFFSVWVNDPSKSAFQSSLSFTVSVWGAIILIVAGIISLLVEVVLTQRKLGVYGAHLEEPAVPEPGPRR